MCTSFVCMPSRDCGMDASHVLGACDCVYTVAFEHAFTRQMNVLTNENRSAYIQSYACLMVDIGSCTSRTREMIVEAMYALDSCICTRVCSGRRQIMWAGTDCRMVTLMDAMQATCYIHTMCTNTCRQKTTRRAYHPAVQQTFKKTSWFESSMQRHLRKWQLKTANLSKRVNTLG